MYAGTSCGGFGGGPSTNFPSSSDRSDVDLVAVGELENQSRSRQRRETTYAAGELLEQVLELQSVREQIAAEVVTAAADVASFRRQMEIAQEATAAAERSYRLNEESIRANEGLPIELLQSITAMTDARNAYIAAAANYNRAQYQLLRALGSSRFGFDGCRGRSFSFGIF